MRHLYRCKFSYLYRITVLFILFVVLIFQLYNAPYTAAQQAVVFFRVFILNRNIIKPEIGKFGKKTIFLYIERDGEPIDNSMAAVAAQLGENFLRLIRAHKVIGKDAFYSLNTFFDDILIIGAAVLT